MQLSERVKETKKSLRRETLRKILVDFNHDIMMLSEEDLEAKYLKMEQSPFIFFRGSAYLFYYDVMNHWFPYHTPEDRPTWIQGDLHFANFGAFHNEVGDLVFDMNDFDEGYLGSYLNDLLRMSVSLALVCRELAYSIDEQLNVIQAYIESYYEQMEHFWKRKDSPEHFYVTKKTARGPVKKLLKKLEKRSDEHLLNKVTIVSESERQFAGSEEIFPLDDADKKMFQDAWPSYIETIHQLKNAQQYQVKDVALKKGSGTASIGLERFFILIVGEQEKEELGNMILEMKEVRVPVPAYFMPYYDDFWATFPHQGQRVVMTQRAMHHKADPHLGYLTIDGREFYIRERSPYKKKLKLEAIQSVEDLIETVQLMAKITAKAHARADADLENEILTYHSEDEIRKAIGQDVDGFIHYISHWAISYGNQVERDYVLFMEHRNSLKNDKSHTSQFN